MHFAQKEYQCVCLCVIIAIGTIVVGCDETTDKAQNEIVVGTILPFSGEQAAVGFNIEQAISLAVADVNEAGGVFGRQLALVSRDSNSGSDRGLDEARALLYDKKIKYVIGPEENALAKTLVPDIKAANVLNILPGVASPIVQETGDKGAWMHLAPSPSAVGCAMATKAIQEGHKTAASVISSDDYQTMLAAAFNSHFSELGGRSVGSVVIKPGSRSYLEEIEQVNDLGADITLMMAYPTTASIIIGDWTISDIQGRWYLPPTLYTEVFLQNIPVGALDGFSVFSPSLSVTSECHTPDEADPSKVICKRDNIALFTEHYKKNWSRDEPLPASLFYYDAVVLLAFGLQRAIQQGEANPSPKVLRSRIMEIAEKPGVTVRWDNIKDGLESLAKGQDIAYSGAAAEYRFDSGWGEVSYGEAIHKVIDTWSIKHKTFLISDSIGIICKQSTLD